MPSFSRPVGPTYLLERPCASHPAAACAREADKIENKPRSAHRAAEDLRREGPATTAVRPRRLCGCGIARSIRTNPAAPPTARRSCAVRACPSRLIRPAASRWDKALPRSPQAQVPHGEPSRQDNSPIRRPPAHATQMLNAEQFGLRRVAKRWRRTVGRRLPRKPSRPCCRMIASISEPGPMAPKKRTELVQAQSSSCLAEATMRSISRDKASSSGWGWVGGQDAGNPRGREAPVGERRLCGRFASGRRSDASTRMWAATVPRGSAGPCAPPPGSCRRDLRSG